MSNREHRVAIGPHDLRKIRKIFNTQETPIPRRRMAFYYNGQLDRWEVYDCGLIIANTTLMAHYEVDEGWIES